MTLVKPVDLRKSGIGTCKQARAWAKRNGIAYSDFRHGIEADRIRHIEDGQAMIAKAIAAAEKREAAENG